jgi:hypothetical protein
VSCGFDGLHPQTPFASAFCVDTNNDARVKTHGAQNKGEINKINTPPPLYILTAWAERDGVHVSREIEKIQKVKEKKKTQRIQKKPKHKH